MRRLIAVLIPIFAFAFASLATAQNIGGSAEGRKLKNPYPLNDASIKAGAAGYRRQCRFCHGNDAKGNAKTAPKHIVPPPSDLTDQKWDRGSTDGELFLVIKNGAGPKFDMEPQKVLKDDDIWHVVNFLRSLAVKK